MLSSDSPLSWCPRFLRAGHNPGLYHTGFRPNICSSTSCIFSNLFPPLNLAFWPSCRAAVTQAMCVCGCMKNSSKSLSGNWCSDLLIPIHRRNKRLWKLDFCLSWRSRKIFLPQEFDMTVTKSSDFIDNSFSQRSLALEFPCMKARATPHWDEEGGRTEPDCRFASDVG